MKPVLTEYSLLSSVNIRINHLNKRIFDYAICMARVKGSDASEYWNRYFELCDDDAIVISKAGLKQSTFWGWKDRKVYPTTDASVKIADILGTTVEYLVTGNEEYRYKPVKLPLAIISLARDLLGLSEARLEEIRQIIRVWHGLDSDRIVHDSGNISHAG